MRCSTLATPRPELGSMERVAMKTNRLALASVALPLSCAATGIAQESRASIAGTVTDPTGAVVASAKLQLTNVETGVVFPTTTNDVGQYRYLFLNPGSYKLQA